MRIVGICIVLVMGGTECAFMAQTHCEIKDYTMSYNKERISFFPQESLEKEVVDILVSANICDGGYESTGDVALEAKDSKEKQEQISDEEVDIFLIECGINPKEFFGR